MKKTTIFLLIIKIFFNLSDSVMSAEYSDYVFQGPQGLWTKDGTIVCFSTSYRMRDAFPRQDTTLNHTKLGILNCQLSNYLDELDALNINKSSVKNILHTFSQDKPFQHSNFTEGLTINELSLNNLGGETDVFANNPDFLEPLSELTSLELYNLEVSKLPETMKLSNLSLENRGLIRNWGNCRHLQQLRIVHFSMVDRVNIPKWPENCTKLKYVQLQRIHQEKLREIADHLENAAPYITRLDVTLSGVDFLTTQLIKSSKNLTYLSLQDSNIYDDESFMKTFARLHMNLPNTIEWLDLRNNRISRASGQEAAALFAAARRVWLAGNSLLCDCDNRALIDAIQQHREQVQDYDLLQCVVTGEYISSISTAVLCKTVLKASLATALVLILLIGVTIYLLRRCGEQLRMFLYSRGLCVSCLHRDELDEKPYDAFLSFAHEDHEYVESTLLPGLENCPERYRVCVHYRDWPVGGWIPNQIMRSVQQSRRTLILLSKSFVTSPWSNLELKYALTNAAEDTTAKVIVLILDDVLDMVLNDELRRFLTYNIYLRCDDQWFWEKLRYAMPHRPSEQATNLDDNNDEIGDPDVIVTHQLEPENIPNETV